MSENNMSEKFKNKFEISYEEFLLGRTQQLVGLIKKFMQKYGQEEVLESVTEYMDEENSRNIKQNLGGMKIENFNQFKEIFKQILSADFYKNSSTFTIVEDSDEKLEFRFTECLWVDVMKQLNFDGDLGDRVFCHTDYAIAKAFNPHIKFSRTKTIMQGQEYCNHCYEWEEEEENLPSFR